MFSALRSRLRVSPTTVIATLALIFAMTGGAYAANKFLITSTKQISPKVLKALKGASGKNGAAGPAGPAGPAGAGTAGAAGPQGSAGAKGETGAPGAPGAKGENGAPGTNGKDGKTGFTETLPSEETETGAWGGRTAGAQTMLLPISFTLPVDPAPTLVFVGPEETAVGCPGIAPDGLPSAAPGKLCVYAGVQVNAALSSPPSFTIEEEEQGTGIKSTPAGVGPAGTVLSFTCAAVCFAQGAWAVTAE